MLRDMVSVCPFCILYKRCTFSPCLVPLQQYIPYAIRKSEYADIAEICLENKVSASENDFSDGGFSDR